MNCPGPSNSRARLAFSIHAQTGLHFVKGWSQLAGVTVGRNEDDIEERAVVAKESDEAVSLEERVAAGTLNRRVARQIHGLGGQSV